MLRKILLAVLIIFALGIGGLYAFLSLNGPRIFSEQASAITNRKITVASVRPVLPAGIVLKGVAIDQILSVDRVRVTLDPLSLLKGQARITRLTVDRPVLFLERGADAGLRAAAVEAPQQETSSGKAVESPAGKTMPVTIRDVRILNGVVRLKDLRSNREWKLTKITGDLQDIPLSGESIRTVFALTASLEGLDIPFLGHAGKASGWLNWAAKDMDASVMAVDESGRVSLEMQMASINNDVQAKGHVRLIPSQSKQASGSRSGAVESVVLGVLSAVATDIDADFSFRTTMDRFDVAQIALSGKVSSNIETGKTFGNVVDEIRAVGEELLKDK